MKKFYALNKSFIEITINHAPMAHCQSLDPAGMGIMRHNASHAAHGYILTHVLNFLVKSQSKYVYLSIESRMYKVCQ